MPFKQALAIALAAILAPLAASTAQAAPKEPAPSASHAHKTPAAKPATSKVRPASPKIAAARRKHDMPKAHDTRPDGHGASVAISMARPLDGAFSKDAPKADTKRMDPKKDRVAQANASGKKIDGKKREARKAEAKKTDGKKPSDKGAVPVVAAAITEPLPPLPPAKPAEPTVAPQRTPLAIGAKKGHKLPCLQAAIDVARGTEEDHLALTKCDGSPAPLAVEHVSILLRPGNVARPTTDMIDLARASKGKDKVAPGIARIDEGLVERLGVVTTHFAKAGQATKVHVVSGYRPSSAGSYHASGRAIDFKIDGVTNEDLVAFCKTLDDTGCGYYPNSSFVHMDVRDPGTGHVAWIDASGPGETPNYVASWPPPKPADDADLHDKKDSRAMIEDLLATLEKELPKMPQDDHPAEADKKDADAPKASIEKDLEQP